MKPATCQQFAMRWAHPVRICELLERIDNDALRDSRVL